MMKAKRFLAVLMSAGMAFAMCACVSAESGRTDAKETVTAETGNGEESAAAEDEFQPFYDAVAEFVYKNYIEPNGITEEEFKWPDDLDDAWPFLFSVMDTYSSYERWGYDDYEELKAESIKIHATSETEEDEAKLMIAFLDGMIVWYEENHDPHERSEFYTTCLGELPVFQYDIAEKISFADMEAYQ